MLWILLKKCLFYYVEWHQDFWVITAHYYHGQHRHKHADTVHGTCTVERLGPISYSIDSPFYHSFYWENQLHADLTPKSYISQPLCSCTTTYCIIYSLVETQTRDVLFINNYRFQSTENTKLNQASQPSSPVPSWAHRSPNLRSQPCSLGLCKTLCCNPVIVSAEFSLEVSTGWETPERCRLKLVGKCSLSLFHPCAILKFIIWDFWRKSVW